MIRYDSWVVRYDNEWMVKCGMDVKYDSWMLDMIYHQI